MAAARLLPSAPSPCYNSCGDDGKDIENVMPHVPQPELPEDELRLCPLYGRDAPVLMLLWFMWALIYVQLSLMQSPVVGLIATAVCLFLAIMFTIFSAKRSNEWCVFSALCFAVTAVAFAGGLIVRLALPPPSDIGWVNLRAFYLCLIVLAVSLSCVLVLSRLLPLCGIRILGSSEAWAAREGWGWQPEVRAHMSFGWKCRTSLGLDDVQALQPASWGGAYDEHSARAVQDLLHRRCYRSGEVVLDFAFLLANEHDFLAPIFHHPASPFSRIEQVMLLIMLCVLVVFPVAAAHTWISSPFLQMILILVLITVPRNVTKGVLQRIAADSAAVDLRNTHDLRGADKFRHIVRKRITKPQGEDWMHQIKQALRQKRRQQSLMLFTVSFILTAGVCALCAWAISRRGDPILHTLTSNTVGLAYMFTLRIVFLCLICHRDMSGKRRPPRWFLGFFDRWWHERQEYGTLLRFYTPSLQEQDCIQNFRSMVA